METKSNSHPLRIAAMLAIGAVALTACGTDNDSAGTDAGDDARGEISIVAVPGWTDQTGMAHLYEYVLEENGYEVTVENIGDNAPAFQGLAQGDYDLFGSTWIERTHDVYWEEHQDSLEDLGVWYDEAKLFLAVPEYSEIQSIEDLPDYADELDGQIMGIEPGAGLSIITEDEVMPHYGLDEDFELALSSTSAMISDLETSMENEAEVVVTLWTPFWAYTNYDVRVLEDPDNVYGDAEALHTVGREGFAEDFPEVATMIENFSLTDDEFGDMENTMVNEFDDDDQAAVHAWLDEHPEIVEEMSAHLNS
jgi:glycine betaine/proline transport system substrate-binding protein